MDKNYDLKTRLVIAFSVLTGFIHAQLNYCSSSANSPSDQEIYNVMLNGSQTNTLYSFTNGCANVAPGPGSVVRQYSNFKTLGSFATITQGAVANFSVAENECDGAPYYYSRMIIWIDFNQNGLFTDFGERVYHESNVSISPRNVSGTFLVPVGALTGTTVMRVMVLEASPGVSISPCANYQYGETEDYAITVLQAPACAGTPGANTVSSSAFTTCANNNVNLFFQNPLSNSGLMYKWYSSSTSSLGPYTAIPSASLSTYITGTTQPGSTTWYQASIYCVNGGSTITASPIQINAAPTVTNNVPYLETFEAISTDGQLPNCSWSVSAQPGTASTFTTNTNGAGGFNHAGFYYSPGGTGYYYSNGIQLYAGVVYSASILYRTDNSGSNNWTNLSILYGSTQSTNGLVPIATTTNLANMGSYTSLSNTFVAGASGIYYMAVKGSNNGGCCSYDLVWDNLQITAPCSLNPVNVYISPITNVYCSGKTLALLPMAPISTRGMADPVRPLLQPPH